MRRYNFFQGQFPTFTEVNDAFSGAEDADRALASDLGFFGIVQGGSAAQAAIPNLSVVVGATAYDQFGQRVNVPPGTTVDVSKDYLGVSTAVGTNGNKRVVSVFAVFARNPSYSRNDTETPPQTVLYNQYEGYQVVVYQGAEGASPAPPAFLSNGVLLCDVTLNKTGGVAQTAVHTDGVAAGGSPTGHDVSTSRAQLILSISHAPTWPGISTTSLRAAFTSVSAYLDTVSASGVLDYLGSDQTTPAGAWADGSYLAARPGLAAAVSDLVGTIGATTGAALLGAAPIVGANSTITPGSGGVQAALLALKSSANIDKTAGPAWANGDANPSALLSTFVNAVITALAASTGNGGTARVGGVALPTLTGGAAIPLGTLYTQLVALKVSANLDFSAVTGTGFNIPAGSVQSALQSVANQSLSVGNVNHWTNDNTFDKLVPTLKTGSHYNLAASTTLTRAEHSVISSSGGTVSLGLCLVTLPQSGNAAQYIFPPNGSTFTQLAVRLAAQAVRSPDALPGTLPAVTLFRQNVLTGAATGLAGPVSDTSANNTAYKLAHDIVVSGFSDVVDYTTNLYFYQITGELGVNKQDININTARWTATVPSIDEGAS